MRSRWARLLSGPRLVGGAAAGLCALAYGYWVANAPSETRPSGDVIVAHAGQGGRLLRAMELADDGAAPVLVIMFGETVYQGYARDLCGQVEPYEVLCPTPSSSSTRGEAEALADLVDERRWRRVIVVTSDYHLRRAAHLDRRCAGVETVPVGVVYADRTVGDYLVNVVREMAAWPPAVLRPC